VVGGLTDGGGLMGELLLAQAEVGFRTPRVEWDAILPEVVLVVGALLILVVGALTRVRPLPGTYALVSVATAGAALVAAADQWDQVSDGEAGPAVVGAVVVDGFSVFFGVLLCCSVILAVLLADAYLRREGLEGPEFYVLVLLSASGAVLMAAANDLIIIFLGLEILSIALYVLAGYHARRAESQEAAMKYFVLGAFSSAFFLYGVALVYGATGSTNLGEIGTFLRANAVTSSGVLLAGFAMLIVGLGFKVAAVPFHMWTPDVYQGAPTPVTGFMAAAAKAAGFAALLRILLSTFATYRWDWQPLVWVLAVLTLVVGSVVALVQDDIKRMLAYSSIAHAGYVLVGLQAGSGTGVAGALFYLLTYTFMVLGSFGVVTLVGRRGDAAHDLDAYRGLSSRRPGLALVFTVLLLAQLGVPLTAGFLAKFYVISAAVESRSYALALIAMVAAVVAAFFYLRIVVVMYMGGSEETDAEPRIGIPVGAGAALAATLVFTLVVGFLPETAMEFARKATLLLT
jgi:NADH-quinone oxidoreductase subunit N